MACFTIEATYLLPVFKHTTVEAPTLDHAIRRVLADDDWEDSKEDYESARPAFITGAWNGPRAFPDGSTGLPVPEEYAEKA